MTETITIPQSAIESLSAGTYSLTVSASSGIFSSEVSEEFITWNHPKIILPVLGEYNTAFSFDITIVGINEEATVTGMIDGEKFYQLNYAKDGTYNVKVTDGVILSLNGGSHTISFSLEDSRSKTATASTTFVRTSTKPVVAVTANIGVKKASFAIPYTIKNAKSEHPSLMAYMDALTDIIADIPDASIANSILVNSEVFNRLSNGSHTVIIVVTNDIGSTTKNVSFTKTNAKENYTGLKLGYKDDTWDADVLTDRIFSEREVNHEGHTYLSFKDETPYETEGEVVTGNLLASFSRGIQNALASNVVQNPDGSYTESSNNGISNLAITEDGYVEVFTDNEGNTLTKNVFFNSDKSIAESTTFTRS